MANIILKNGLGKDITYTGVETMSVTNADDPSTKVEFKTEDSIIPSGGTTGQALVKNSDTDYDVKWGSVFRPQINVISPTSQTITCTKGSTTYTQTGTDVTFTLEEFGTWTISGGDTINTVLVDNVKLYTVKLQDIFGIKRSLSSANPAWIRTDDSVYFNAVASIGSSGASSDFDNYYPYNEIERITLDTNDVMVKIPKFYFRRYQENNYEFIQISNKGGNGFSLHPAFNRNNVELDYIYVGAYKTSSNNKSVSGAAPQVSQTRATMRTNARAKGTGWGLIDIATLNAIQILIMVEYATNDVQSAIGEGWSASSHSGAINTGSCDGVYKLTGRPAGTSNNVDVVWRGIEGFWGNVWEWTDGLNWNNGVYYVSTNPSDYADDTATNYTALSYTGATNWSLSYISELGLDTDNSWAMMPKTASGSSSTYYCDGIWSNTGWRVFRHGGDWDYGALVGLFASCVNDASLIAAPNLGSRLLYLPLS